MLEHHNKRFEEIRRILQKSGRQTAYETAGQISREIRSKNWEEFPLEQTYFAVEETLAHLDNLEEHSFVKRQEQSERKIYFGTWVSRITYASLGMFHYAMLNMPVSSPLLRALSKSIRKE